MPSGSFPGNSREFIKVAKAWGFEEHREGGGDHLILRKGEAQISVRHPSDDVNAYTVQMACKILGGITWDQFAKGPEKKQAKQIKQIKLMPSRRKLIEWLYAQPDHKVEDPNGFAGSHASVKLGYKDDKNGVSAFASLLAAAEKEGQVKREVRGKRTYRIELVLEGPRVQDALLDAGLLRPAGQPAPPHEGDIELQHAIPTPPVTEPVPQFVDVTVEGLAEALLTHVLRVIEARDPERLQGEISAIAARLAKETEYATTMRAKVSKIEQELREERALCHRLLSENKQLKENITSVIAAAGRPLPPGMVKTLERSVKYASNGRSK